MSSVTSPSYSPFVVSESLLKAMTTQRKELTLHTPDKKRAFMIAAFEAARQSRDSAAPAKKRVLLPLSPAGPIESSSSGLGVKRDSPDFVPLHLVEFTVSDIETDEEEVREQSSIKRAPPRGGAGDVDSLTALFANAALNLKKP